MAPTPIKVALIATHRLNQPGSMSVYAQMIEDVLKPFGDQVEIKPINLLEYAPNWPIQSSRWRQRLNQLWLLYGAPRLLKTIHTDIYHLSDGSAAYVLAGLPPEQCVVTVHDLIPALQCQGMFPVQPPGPFARWLIFQNLKVLQSITNILIDSSCTRDDIRKLLVTSSQLEILFPTLRLSLLDHGPKPLPTWQERSDQGIRTILHIGNNGFYKNRAAVVRVFQALAQTQTLKLILAGDPPDETLQKLISELKVREKINIYPYPDDQQLAQLYSQASILLFPSYYEGFGWPPLEAMAFGCPVVCSNTGSLPEIVGQAALTAPPEDIQKLAHHCQSLLLDSALAEKQIDLGFDNIKRFSPQQMAETLIKTYQKINNE